MKKKKNHFLLCILIVTVSIIMCIYEWRFHYAFLNDDNLNCNLANFIHTLRAIKNFELPVYNFNEFLGYPLFSSGQTPVFNPVFYLSALISKYILKDISAIIDVFVILHVLISVITFFYFIYELKLNKYICFFGAITWAINTHTIYLSGVWQLVSPYGAFFPLLMIFTLKTYREKGWRNCILGGIIRAFLLFCGQPNYWIYCIVFELTVVLIFILFDIRAYKTSIKDYLENKLFQIVKRFTFSYIIAILLAMPLLLPLINQMNHSISRNGQLPFEEFARNNLPNSVWSIILFVFPFLNIFIKGNMMWVLSLGIVGGGLVIVMLLTGVFIPQIKQKCILSGNKIKFLTFYYVGIFSFLWGVGAILCLVYFVPVLNRFRYSLKLGLFATFFLTVVACYGLKYLLIFIVKKVGKSTYFKDWKIKRCVKKTAVYSILAVTLIIIQTISFWGLYQFAPISTFYRLNQEMPLKEPLKEVFEDARIISIGFSLENIIDSRSLTFKYSTLFNLNQFAGNEALEIKDTYDATLGINYHFEFYNKKNGPKWIHGESSSKVLDIPIDYLRKWGVKWYIFSSNVEDEKIPLELTLYSKDSFRKVYMDNKARPMLYSDNESIKILSYSISSNKISALINTERETVLKANFIFRDFFSTYVDGELVKTVKSNENQLSAVIPAGIHKVEFKYKDPYLYYGLYITVATILLLLLFYFKFKIRKKSLKLEGLNGNITYK